MKRLTSHWPDMRPILDEVREVAEYLWERGWAECNGGNLSINVTEQIEADWLDKEDAQDHSLDCAYPGIRRNVFFITGSGHRFRDIANDPESHTCLVLLNEDGTRYRVFPEHHPMVVKPTSELPTHLLIHEFLKHQKSDARVVLHTHPTEMIAVSHLSDYKEEATLNQALWSMLPEIKVVIPAGVGLVPYALPSSQALAQATLSTFKHGHQIALWEMHGLMAVGSNPQNAFDIIDTANKAAQILLMCRAAGETPKGLSPGQLTELARAFKLED